MIKIIILFLSSSQLFADLGGSYPPIGGLCLSYLAEERTLLPNSKTEVEELKKILKEDYEKTLKSSPLVSKTMTSELPRPLGSRDFLINELKIIVSGNKVKIEGGIAALAKNFHEVIKRNNLDPSESFDLAFMVVTKEGELFPLALHDLSILDQVPAIRTRFYDGESKNLEFLYWAYSMAEGLMPIASNRGVFFGHDIGHIEEFARFPEIMKMTRKFYTKLMNGIDGEPSYLIRKLKEIYPGQYTFLKNEKAIEVLNHPQVKKEHVAKAVNHYNRYAEILSEEAPDQMANFVYKGELTPSQLERLNRKDEAALELLLELLKKQKIFHLLGGASRDGYNTRYTNVLGTAIKELYYNTDTKEKYFHRILNVINYSEKNGVNVRSFMESLSSYDPEKTPLALDYLEYADDGLFESFP